MLYEQLYSLIRPRNHTVLLPCTFALIKYSEKMLLKQERLILAPSSRVWSTLAGKPTQQELEAGSHPQQEIENDKVLC